MIVNVRIKDDIIVGYRIYPINKEDEYIEIERIPDDLLSGAYTVRNHQLIKKEEIYEELEIHSNKEEVNKKVYEKETLLKAFDKYKSDVVYGIIEETEEIHEEILIWYKNLKNDVPDSLINPPKDILRYMED